jgi:hypothetical protein
VDPRLRVILLDGATPVRSATPAGTPERVEWDVTDLAGHTVTLLLEDESETGGLAVDDVTLYEHRDGRHLSP